MKKVYNILNVSIELTASKDIIEFVNKSIYDLPMVDTNPHKYYVSYIKDPKQYMELCNKFSSKKNVRFYGDEYKVKHIEKDVIYLIDKNSVIIHDNNRFAIIGLTEFSKNHIVYLIREAIYEEYIIKNYLLIHSAAFAENNNSSLLIGRPGAGKTTLLLEFLLNSNYDYISNDLVGCIKNNAMASIIPVRIANGTMSRFDNKEYTDLKEKKTINLNDFLLMFNLNIKNNIPIKNIIFPKFNIDGEFCIKEVIFDTSMDILKGQVLNFNDDVRPYLWVNEYDRNDINKEELLNKLINLINNTHNLEINYGKSISKENIKVMKRVIET